MKIDDLLEKALQVITDVGDGDWKTQTPEWQAKAKAWLDAYDALDELGGIERQP